MPFWRSQFLIGGDIWSSKEAAVIEDSFGKLGGICCLGADEGTYDFLLYLEIRDEVVGFGWWVFRVV